MGVLYEALIKAIRDGLKVFSRKDDDYFDRLSNRYTIALLVVCSVFLATKTYVGEPIKCFTPKEFHGNWVKYTDNLCWVQNTYFVPFDESLPLPIEHKDYDPVQGAPQEIPYYQWVPIILAAMVACFGVPVAVWQLSMASTGYNIQDIVKLTSKADNIDPAKRDGAVKYIASQLRRNIGYHRLAKGRRRIGKGYSMYLYILYIITKLIYIAVPIFLLWALNFLMGEGYWDYGIRAVNGIIDEGEYIENPMFPRISYCSYKVRRLGQNIHRYTVQCLLSVNLFNERVFLVIWWWFVILSCLSALGLLVFVVQTQFPGANFMFIMKQLHCQGVATRANAKDVERVKMFTNHFLKQDGVLCLRLVAKNVQDVVTAEIVAALYKLWREDMKKKELDDVSWRTVPDEESIELNSPQPERYVASPISPGREDYIRATFNDY